MKKSKTIWERINGEVYRFQRRFPPVFGRYRVRRCWLKMLSDIAGQPVRGVDGTLYVIGDSHTNFFGGAEFMHFIKILPGVNTSMNLVPFMKTFYIGSSTAYSLPREDSQTQAWQKTEEIVKRGLIPPGSPILLCFGEIDCRVHILKQSDRQGHLVEDIARDIVQNYMTYAEWLISQGFYVACWGAIATRKKGPNSQGDFPVFGTEIERNEATRIFNSVLEEACRQRNIRFCSIFEQMVDAQMETLAVYISSDKCHLSQRAAPLLARALVDAGLIRQTGGHFEVVVSG